MGKEITAMEKELQEKKTDCSGTPGVQQEPDRKEEKKMTRKWFWSLPVLFLCLLSLMMILFLLLLIFGNYIASRFQPFQPDDPRGRMMGVIRDDRLDDLGKHAGGSIHRGFDDDALSRGANEK